MSPPITRRTAGGLLAAAAVSAPRASALDSPSDRWAALEARLGGRIGASALDTGSGRHAGYRQGERIPLCSTFKLLAAGLILTRVDRGEERLDRRIVFGRDEVVVGSPLTGPRAGPEGMTLAEICRAAITRSDNTAGNLMLASFGGPGALTGFLRGLGDPDTRLDRTEPTLNESLPDDPRDTTTPAAMIGAMRRLLVDDALSEGSRTQLRAWLEANETGAARIRAGMPAGWRVGDKTGTGERGSAGDVAILWPAPDRAPLLLALYATGSSRSLPDLNAAIAEMARIVIAELSAP